MAWIRPADRLQTKNTPVIRFVLDPGVKLSAEASQTLRDVLPEDSPSVADEVESDDDDEVEENVAADRNTEPS